MKKIQNLNIPKSSNELINVLKEIKCDNCYQNVFHIHLQNLIKMENYCIENNLVFWINRSLSSFYFQYENEVIRISNHEKNIHKSENQKKFKYITTISISCNPLDFYKEMINIIYELKERKANERTIETRK